MNLDSYSCWWKQAPCYASQETCEGEVKVNSKAFNRMAQDSNQLQTAENLKIGCALRANTSKSQICASDSSNQLLTHPENMHVHHVQSTSDLQNTEAKQEDLELPIVDSVCSSDSEREYIHSISGSLPALDDALLQALMLSVKRVLQPGNFNTEMLWKPNQDLELKSKSSSPPPHKNTGNDTCLSPDDSLTDQYLSVESHPLPAYAEVSQLMRVNPHKHDMCSIAASSDSCLSSLLPVDQKVQFTTCSECEVQPLLQLSSKHFLDMNVHQISSENTLQAIKESNGSHLKQHKGKRMNKLYRSNRVAAVKHYSLKRARRNKGRCLDSTSEENACSDKKPLCLFCQQSENKIGLGYLYGPYKQESIQSESSSGTKSLRDNSSKHELWVHEDCAIWAPGVYLAGAKLMGLQETMFEGRKSKCTVCNKPQAALHCRFRGCRAVYHYPCAMLAKCKLSDDQFEVSCWCHNNYEVTAK